MLSKTRHAEWNPNAFPWSIDKKLSGTFEDFFAYYLRRAFAGPASGVSVRQTARSGDGGRDIEFEYSTPLQLGGIELPAAGERPQRLFIECKVTSGPKLDEGFLADVSQHVDEDFDAYLLVTNAVITPHTHHLAVQIWRRLGKAFLLLDRARLYRAWSEAGLLDEARQLGLVPPEPPPEPPSFTGVCVAAQTEEFRPGQLLRTYLTVRNHSARSQSLQISLAADIDWSSGDEAPLHVILAPGEDQVHVLRSSRERYDVASPLRLNLSSEGRAHSLTIAGAKPQLVLDPPFVGEGHRALLAKIRSTVESSTGFDLISIHGEAGVGKSRVLEEARPALDGAWFMDRLGCDPRSGHFDIASFAARAAAAALRPEESEHERPAALGDVAGFLDCLGLRTVLLLEDLHHAGVADIDALKAMVTRPPEVATPIVFIVTGRDDHSFPNADYYALLDLLRSEERLNVSSHALESLSFDDAETLIRAVASDLPDAAVARVHRLGECNPFIIIEVLQYLLDMGLARLLSRRTIGVLDPERFIGLDDLPREVEELYERRLTSLGEAQDGPEACRLIIALSCLPPDGTDDLIASWLEQGGDEVLDLLIARRFLLRDAFAGQLRFAHENLYNFLRRWIRQPAHAPRVAADLLDFAGLMGMLDPLAKAELLSVAGHHAEAFALFAPAWAAIQAMSNFSSEEVDRRYYPFLHAIFASARAEDQSPVSLAKVAAAVGYMGVHNFPLVQGERACAQAEDMIRAVYGSAPDGEIFATAIHQLRSHALQNLGRTGLALRRMNELEANFKERGASSPQVAFDLYDRLQEHYRKTNHAEMMLHYGRLASRAVEESADEKLRAAHLITMSMAAIYRTSGAKEAAARALDASEQTGIRRFVVFNQLTRLVGAALMESDNDARLKAVYQEAQALLRLAAANTYSDSIIRLQLLLATLAPHVAPTPEEGRRRAREYILAGQQSSVRLGIGLYDWAFDNLAGAIDSLDPAIVDEQARRRFDTCLERLRRRGLTFIGACSGTYPNALAIANIVRFHAQFRESAAAALIQREVSAYDSAVTMDVESVQRLLRNAIAGKAIFWPKQNRPMLRLPGDSSYFTPII
jgi:hypothetical protein